MNVKEQFLNLTTHTIPFGKEFDYLNDLLPMNILKKDPVGNLYIEIGNNNTTMFASHLDTVGGDVEVNHVIDGDTIKTDGKSILGADDKAGVVIMLYMIEKKVPGLYEFFLGEEVGCQGSKPLVSWIEKNKSDKRYKNINKVISFDRKGKTSIITYQMSDRCCSDEFADSFISELNKYNFSYIKDTGGVLTDSVQFTDLYAECTNVSVGYFNQHSVRENQDIKFLNDLCVACTKIDWENLTVKRKPGTTESLYKYNNYNNYTNHHNYNYNNTSYYDDYDDDTFNNDNWRNTNKNVINSNGITNSKHVTDWKGNVENTTDCVWCEHDKVHCLKTEAIWVDLLGFYTTPDEEIVGNSSNKTNKVENNKINYDDIKSEIIYDSKELSINDNIIHPIFGKGVIKNISPDGKKIEVDFSYKSTGKKLLLLQMAKIKKL